MKSFAIALVAFAGAASSALAGPVGYIVYTDLTHNDLAMVPGNGGGVTTLIDFAGSMGSNGTRMAGIVQVGSSFYVSNGPVPVPDPSTSAIWKIDDLFGTPSVSNFASGEPVQNPTDIEYDADADGLVWQQNPFGPMTQGREEGVYSKKFSGGGVVTSFTEPATNGPTPRYEAGTYMTHNPIGSGYYVMALNGGVLPSGPNPAGDNVSPSTLWRMSINPVTLAASMTLAYDFGTLDPDLVQVRGITAIPGVQALFVTEWLDGKVYKLDLDGSGNVVGINAIASGLNNPECIEWNPFTNKLVISEEADGVIANQRISQINIDGSGYEVLVDQTHARGFAFVVPTPGAAGLAGIAGLVALRRRRA